jgi:hypothetical protein
MEFKNVVMQSDLTDQMASVSVCELTTLDSKALIMPLT